MDIDKKTEDNIKAQIIYMIQYICREYNLKAEESLDDLADWIYAFSERSK